MPKSSGCPGRGDLEAFSLVLCGVTDRIRDGLVKSTVNYEGNVTLYNLK